MNKNTNMKKYIVGAFGWLIIFSACVSAQWVDSGRATLENQKKRDAEAEKRRRKEEALMAAANSNPTSRVLHERLVSAVLKAGESEKILMEATNANLASKALHQRLISSVAEPEMIKILQEAVKTGDRSIVPYLNARWEMGLGPAQHLDIALVALGETQYVDKTIEDLKSEDAAIRYYAVWRLARFNTKESYRKLYELLDDDASRDDHRGADDYVIMPMSWVTMEILRSTVKGPPRGKDAADRAAWKAWFQKNKHLID